MRRHLCLLSAVAGLLIFSLYMAVCSRRAGRCADELWHMSLCLESPLSAFDVQKLLAQKSETDFAVWGELKNQTVTNPELGNGVQAAVVAVWGSAELVLPAATALLGEDNGCLIGEQTVWELFGSTEVVGDEISIGDVRRTIRAVTKQPRSGVVVVGSPGEDFGCSRITLESRAAAESFLIERGLSGHLLRLDYYRSPAWLLELIPGKWSDFSGWEENIRQAGQEAAFLSSAEKNSLECCYEEQCRIYAVCRGIEFLCVVLAVYVWSFHFGKFKKQSEKPQKQAL